MNITKKVESFQKKRDKMTYNFIKKLNGMVIRREKLMRGFEKTIGLIQAEKDTVRKEVVQIEKALKTVEGK